MDNDVSAVLKRSAKNRGGEGVVDDERNAVCVSYFCEFLDIENGESRVSESLAENCLGIGLESLLYLVLGSVSVNEDALDAELLEGVCEEVYSTAVDSSGRDEAVAGFEDIEQ